LINWHGYLATTAQIADDMRDRLFTAMKAGLNAGIDLELGQAIEARTVSGLPSLELRLNATTDLMPFRRFFTLMALAPPGLLAFARRDCGRPHGYSWLMIAKNGIAASDDSTNSGSSSGALLLHSWG
jgi:hypothetical protein